ncbi:hypothetical protein [Nonomuraea endophytica]|uniref:hypothetical protein n=1 Tax=Nonomuraea endophytica TaxID=714136 RepID=UPI0037C87B97
MLVREYDESIEGQVAEPSPERSDEAAARPALLGADPGELQGRWRDLQASFVDDPREAVERADTLLDETTASLHSALEAHVHELREHWKSAGDGDTEQLRTALRDYLDLLHRLLPLAAADLHETR